MSFRDTLCQEYFEKIFSQITSSDSVSGQHFFVSRDFGTWSVRWRAAETKLHEDDVEGFSEPTR